MPFTATIYRVFIGSPSDVIRERAAVSDAIHNWNVTHSADLKTVLLPVRWETHAAPEMGDRPQAIINKQVVRDSDILVGIFRTRLGTPTGQAESGTVEEIREFRKKAKPILLYFSNAPLVPMDATSKQLLKLNKFKKECERDGLVYYYKSIRNLKDQLQRHLLCTVRNLKGAESGAGFNWEASVAEIAPTETVDQLEVEFVHPRKNTVFSAYVNPVCTGQQALNGLMEGDQQGPFLGSNKTYELVVKRSGRAIGVRTTFEQAGVVNGDVIEVRQIGAFKRLA